MITALILTDGRIEPLAATLAALVPGVADGLVADAVVISAADGREVAAIADGVGAAHVIASGGRDPWLLGAEVARREWLLCLEAGDVPADGWIGALERFVAFAGERQIGRLCERPLRLRVAAAVERLAGTRTPGPGHLAHRSLLGPGGFRARLRPVRIAAGIARPPRR